MLRHSELFDPVIRPEVATEFNFERYVEIDKAQKKPTGAGYVESIKRQFYEAGSETEIGKLDKIWSTVGPMVERKQCLAEFINDFRATESKYFFPWLVDLTYSPSMALEMSYGAGHDLDGNWREDILESGDRIIPFIQDDPAFVYNRERQLYVADLVATILLENWSCDVSPLKIVDFGAGRMAWARHHGLELYDYYLRQGHANIYAFDKDESINPKELFKGEEAILKDLGIKYAHEDFAGQLTNPELKDADLIILGGVASYIPPETFYTKIVPAIYMLLKPGGVFFFDKQIDCPCLQWSIRVFDWPNMYLPANATEAVYATEQARKTLWKKGLKFSAEYALDTCSEDPTAVMMTFQKI